MNFNILISHVIQKDPGIIVGPITQFLGAIVNVIFNGVYALTTNHSLGISIIFLTIIARFLMLPLAVKQQKSMAAMQRIQPEIEKIKAKYGNSKDPEIQQKISQETTALFAKNKVNPLSSLVPVFIQFPIFIALNYILNTSFRFITKIGDIYQVISEALIGLLSQETYLNVISDLALPKIPNGMEIDIGTIEGMSKVLNKFSITDWNTLFAKIPADVVSFITPFFENKQSIEMFLGIMLTENSGLLFPGIIIPILSGLTTFLSSYIMSKMQKSSDPNAKMQQKIMMIVMPIFMGVMTISFSAGVGIYWITSSVFQIIQQIILNKRYANKIENKDDVVKGVKGV